MTGAQKYNADFDNYAKKKINDNSDKPFLKGYYYFLLSDGKRSYDGAYSYLCRAAEFVNYHNIVDPSSITFDHYTEYLTQAYIGKSSSYQIVTYSALKNFSRYLKAKGYCEDYMSYIKRPKFSETTETREKREIGFMTKREIDKFLNAIKNGKKPQCWLSRDYAMATVLLNSGIRCAALQKLDITDINFTDGSITVLEKGNKSRKIYLASTTMDNLKDWMTYRDQLVSDKAEKAVFISDRKRRMDRKTIYNIIKSYGSVIDGKHITTHKTRATYGTQLYAKTHDVYFVQECMGHSNPKTTELYIRGQKRDASKKAAELMSGFLS